MKIGLLSPHYAFNYGAVLQAFALKTYLRNQGHDAVILNRRPAYQCAIPSLLGRIARKCEEFAKRNSFGVFEKRFLQPQTSPVIHQNDWEQLPDFKLDAIIVGSDQIWRDDYTFTSFGYNFFLDFLPEESSIKRISYAPSLGKESWHSTTDRTNRVRDLLQKFNSISVREESSIRILKEKFGVEAELVVDPTLLLHAEEYIEALCIKQKASKHIATYILDYDDNFRRKINEISSSLKLPVKNITVKSSKTKLGVFINRFKPMKSVNYWVKNLANAEYVVTNSFHGMVFSIIFRKQFIVVNNEERGEARFKSLLKMFGLEDRLVTDLQTDFKELLVKPINYSTAVTKIESWRSKSINYLQKALDHVP